MRNIDELQAELTAAMAGRPGWREWNQFWSHTEMCGPGEPHTIRRLHVQALGGGRGEIHASKDNRWGQPCDVQDFTDAAEAIAWVETPRSEDTVQHRAAMAEIAAYARRNDVDLAGLKGVKVDSGLNPKRQQFHVVDFPAPVGRVWLTSLGGGEWRVSRNRRNSTVTVPADQAGVKAALRAEIERLTEAS